MSRHKALVRAPDVKSMKHRSGSGRSEGTTVELRRDDYAIVARVVWRDGPRAGLHSDEPLPVDEIMSLAPCADRDPGKDERSPIERRKRPRRSPDAVPSLGRSLEFVGVAAIVLCIAVAVFGVAKGALLAPTVRIEVALAGK